MKAIKRGAEIPINPWVFNDDFCLEIVPSIDLITISIYNNQIQSNIISDFNFEIENTREEYVKKKIKGSIKRKIIKNVISGLQAKNP